MRKGYVAEITKRDTAKRHIGAEIEKSLIEGYKEMSRINLSLAEEAVDLDNEALALAEQKLAECE